jgi:F-type H+-transporting ATPase subunit b
MIASSNFLVPNATLVVEVVAFLVVLWFLGRYVLPVVNKQLEARQEEIRTALEAAETARTEAAEASAQNQEAIDEARRQAREIIAQANKSAERIAAQAEERGRQEYERIVSRADAEIVAARQRAVEQMSAQMATLVLAAARQVIGREVDASAHRGLIDEAVAALRSAAPATTGTQS